MTLTFRREISELAIQSRAAAQAQICRRHGVKMIDAKAIVMHLPLADGGCSRPGCSGTRQVGQASCPKCKALCLLA
jgi:hypothetical protein